MMMLPHFLRQYKNIIVWDFEFASIGGEIKPTSVAYKNILRKNSKTQFKWLRKTDGSVIDGIPYDFEDLPLDDDEATLFVSFFGEAEYSCVKELGWELFEHDHIDCYSEIKILKNGLWNSFSLANIADKLGFDAGYAEDDKTNLRERLGQDKVTIDEIANVERYNIEDVKVTEQLFFYITHHYQEMDDPDIWVQALNRGDISKIAAKISRRGYPVDVHAWDKFLENFDTVVEKVLEKAHNETGCFPKNGEKRKFDHNAFTQLVEKLNIYQWPRTDGGSYMTDKDTLRRFDRYPEIKLIKEAQNLKNSTKLKDLPIDRRDDRAKTLCSYFGTKTGRATPSTARHLPNMPPCFRPFLVPEYEKPLLFVDYKQQEFAVAAALSDDKVMLDTYNQADPYVYLGHLAGILPLTAGKEHPKRQMYKTVCLMTMYGAGVRSMATDMNEPIEVAEKALQDHQRLFHKFWKWQQEYLDAFMMEGIKTVADGWT
jgi:DNA polymerase I-like protein with 3'-5' exonuclease and polymerase domains